MSIALPIAFNFGRTLDILFGAIEQANVGYIKKQLLAL